MTQSIKIHEYWCEQQQKDYEELMTAVDAVGANSLALASSGGAQAYTQFIESRDTFKSRLIDLTKNYRYVEQV